MKQFEAHSSQDEIDEIFRQLTNECRQSSTNQLMNVANPLYNPHGSPPPNSGAKKQTNVPFLLASVLNGVYPSVAPISCHIQILVEV
jgi:hypothetical protein